VTYLGLDLGGTFVKGLVIDEHGRELANGSAATPRTGPADVIVAMRDLGQRLVAGRRLRGVGVAVPGVIDLKRGEVKFLPNVPGEWEGRPAARELGDALGAPAFLLNDVRAATYGEWHFGAGRGCEHFVMVAVGTGIGGGIVADGKLVMGIDGLAGEVGHMALELHGPPCACGGWGCAEALVSGKALSGDGRQLAAAGGAPGLLQAAGGDPEKITPALIARAAEAGDPGAKRLMDEAGYRLGILIGNVVILLNPARVIVGGGIAQAGALLFDGIRQTLVDRVGWFLRHTSVEIVPAELGEEAGALGAAAWARDRGAGASS
jgi:glucokinase